MDEVVVQANEDVVEASYKAEVILGFRGRRGHERQSLMLLNGATAVVIGNPQELAEHRELAMVQGASRGIPSGAVMVHFMEVVPRPTSEYVGTMLGGSC